MWQRWLDSMKIEFHWWKRDIIRRWRLDTPLGMSGILLIISGVLLLFVLGNGAAHLFRFFVPWVSGSHIGDVYWQSIGFGIKASLTFMLFCVSLIAFIVFKLSERQ